MCGRAAVSIELSASTKPHPCCQVEVTVSENVESETVGGPIKAESRDA